MKIQRKKTPNKQELFENRKLSRQELVDDEIFELKKK